MIKYLLPDDASYREVAVHVNHTSAHCPKCLQALFDDLRVTHRYTIHQIPWSAKKELQQASPQSEENCGILSSQLTMQVVSLIHDFSPKFLDVVVLPGLRFNTWKHRRTTNVAAIRAAMRPNVKMVLGCFFDFQNQSEFRIVVLLALWKKISALWWSGVKPGSPTIFRPEDLIFCASPAILASNTHMTKARFASEAPVAQLKLDT